MLVMATDNFWTKVGSEGVMSGVRVKNSPGSQRIDPYAKSAAETC